VLEVVIRGCDFHWEPKCSYREYDDRMGNRIHFPHISIFIPVQYNYFADKHELLHQREHYPRSMGSDVNRLVKHSRPYKQEQTPHGHKKKKKKTTIYDDYKDLE
jgi:hypothetical protein